MSYNCDAETGEDVPLCQFLVRPFVHNSLSLSPLGDPFSHSDTFGYHSSSFRIFTCGIRMPFLRVFFLSASMAKIQLPFKL